MAAAASSLKSQAQDLVQVVASFKTRGAQSGLPVAMGQVRSVKPKSVTFKGAERRLGATVPRPARAGF
jgi:hypothetical protein